MKRLDYEIKESPRAKHVRLKVSLYDASLVVVVPQGFDRECIPEVLQEKRSWIERARRSVVEQRRMVGTEPPVGRPESVLLRALEEEWSVEYRPSRSLRLAAAENGDHALLIRGQVDDIEACRKAVGEWVKVKARAHLVPWVLAVSRAQELPISRVAVRAQRTCWATCSTRRTISVNRKLLFLPARLVEYVFIHELCHTVHMDHSRKFWGMVAERARDYKDYEAELRTAWRYVPTWLGQNGASHR
jgi:predicted metal-dependent hydrolase